MRSPIHNRSTAVSFLQPIDLRRGWVLISFATVRYHSVDRCTLFDFACVTATFSKLLPQYLKQLYPCDWCKGLNARGQYSIHTGSVRSCVLCQTKKPIWNSNLGCPFMHGTNRLNHFQSELQHQPFRISICHLVPVVPTRNVLPKVVRQEHGLAIQFRVYSSAHASL